MDKKKLIALVTGLALCGSIFAAPKFGTMTDVAHHHHHHHHHGRWGWAPPPPPPPPPLYRGWYAPPPPPPPPPVFHGYHHVFR